MENDRPWEAVLAFWFGPGEDDGEVAGRQGRLWWSKDEAVDRGIRERFGGILREAAAGQGEPWPKTPRARLARVILFDQLSRNMHRGTPAAFATDPLARHQARVALELGDEAGLRSIQRVFLYMPFEHAEDPAAQDLAVERFTALRDQAAPALRGVFDDYLAFAHRHRDIIRRFGRFPHRNAILGRPSTPEETAFLREPGSSF